jgi:hypothetical protein
LGKIVEDLAMEDVGTYILWPVVSKFATMYSETFYYQFFPGLPDGIF